MKNRKSKKTILLTNDDGIFSDGIMAVYKQLIKKAHVVIVAPDYEKSSVSHGITLSSPLSVNQVKREGKLFGYAVNGTPADCVKLACAELLNKRPDLIVSGINLGPNDGCSVFYSGTVAAAREGALLGIPSVAVSLATFVDPDYQLAARFMGKIVEFMNMHKLPKGCFLNVNVPNKKKDSIRGIKITKQGERPIHSRFYVRTNPHSKLYYWLAGEVDQTEKDLETDTYALSKNYVTVTPLSCSTNNELLIREIEKIGTLPKKI